MGEIECEIEVTADILNKNYPADENKRQYLFLNVLIKNVRIYVVDRGVIQDMMP